MPHISWERLGIPQEELGIMAGKKDVLACCHQELTSDKQQTVDGRFLWIITNFETAETAVWGLNYFFVTNRPN